MGQQGRIFLSSFEYFFGESGLQLEVLYICNLFIFEENDSEETSDTLRPPLLV